MSTRCLIGRKIKDNKVEYIYCHHDGYLDGVGEILKTYYTNDDVIDKLMALGDLSALGKIAEQDILKSRGGNKNDDYYKGFSLGMTNTKMRIQELAKQFGVEIKE